MKNTQKGFVPVLIILGLVIVGGGVYLFKKENPKIEKDNEEVQVNNVPNIESESLQESPTLEGNQVVITNTNTANTGMMPSDDILWAVFDNNLNALKNKDLDSYNKTSYVTLPKEEEQSFIEISQFLYDDMIKLNKKEFTNKIGDDKQVIFTKKSNNNIQQVAFIKINNTWKILAISDRKYVVDISIDSDGDGLADKEELCTASQNPWCKKTDPNKKDTNGDGWWDSTASFMN